MKKGLKSCLFILIAFIALLVGGVVFMFAVEFCPPLGPWPMPPWCEGSSIIAPPLRAVSTPEKDLPTFTVSVPANTPEHTVVYLGLVDETGVLHGYYEMVPAGENLWTLESTQEISWEFENKGRVHYKYNRNRLGFMSDEEFTPDSKEAFRTLTDTDDLDVQDTVEKWRWLPEPGKPIPQYPAHLRAFVPRVNGEPFQKGIVLADFWSEGFENLIESTNQRLLENNFQWVAISPTWDFTQTEPTPVIDRVGVSYTDEELEDHLFRLKEDGFEIYFFPQVCCDIPDESIYTDEWWEAWLVEYQGFLEYIVDFANRYDVKYMSVGPGYYINDYIPPNYREELDALFAGIREQYHGRLGMPVYVEGNITQELYCEEISGAENWDFLAATVWAGITSDLEPTQEELNANVLQMLDSCLRPLHEQYDIPVVLAQVAYPSLDGGLRGTADLDTEDPAFKLWEPYSDKFQTDLIEQAMGMDAVLTAVAQSEYIIGTYPFAYLPDAFPESKEYNIRGKPAEEVISTWYDTIP